MSINTRSPTRAAGGLNFSGGPNTGEFQQIRGGALTASFLSGGFNLIQANMLAAAPTLLAFSGGHAQIWSGAGRLNSCLITNQIQSGQQAFFYDAGSIAGSGINVSGQKCLGATPLVAGLAGVFSGQNILFGVKDRLEFDVPFTSGLCVFLASGLSPFLVTFTPEVQPNALNQN